MKLSISEMARHICDKAIKGHVAQIERGETKMNALPYNPLVAAQDKGFQLIYEEDFQDGGKLSVMSNSQDRTILVVDMSRVGYPNSAKIYGRWKGNDGEYYPQYCSHSTSEDGVFNVQVTVIDSFIPYECLKESGIFIDWPDSSPDGFIRTGLSLIVERDYSNFFAERPGVSYDTKIGKTMLNEVMDSIQARRLSALPDEVKNSFQQKYQP